jgi:hypothetical protein
MNRQIRPSVLAMAVACSLALACSKESATPTGLSPVDKVLASRSDEGLIRGNGQAGAMASAMACATHVNVANSGVFGPAGGTLTFGTSRLIIPPGALRDTVTISATVPDGDASRVEFQPHGLEFFKAAGLQLDVTGCAVSDVPDVVYLSETGEIVERIPAVYDPRWHTIAASIWHFSGYAIAF